MQQPAEIENEALPAGEVERQAEQVFASKVKLSTKVLVALLLLVVAVVSLFLGHYGMNPGETVSAALSFIPKGISYLAYCIQDPSLFSDPSFSIPVSNAERVLFYIRLPRVIVVVLVGAALAVAGASYQGMFKNPLTSPDLLGASAGASLGACIALLLSLSGEFVQLFAFIGGMLAVGAAVWLNRLVDYDPTLGLVLAGIIGWIGLVIPHLARAVVGPNYKVLLPASMFIGAAYLLIVDDLARLLVSIEIPIGILTAILGVPFFVYIFKRNMKGWR